jgi:hypothetical protein
MLRLLAALSVLLGALAQNPACAPTCAGGDCFPSKLQFNATASATVAQYFSVAYRGSYKYVRDLRGPTYKVYVLYQARPPVSARAGTWG